MKKHFVKDLLKKVLVTALSVSMVLQPTGVMAENLGAEEVAIEAEAEAVAEEEAVELDLTAAEENVEAAEEASVIEEAMTTVSGDKVEGVYTLDISEQVKAGNIEVKEYALADLKTTELGQPLLPIESDYFTVYGHPTTTKVKTDDSGAVEFPDGYIGEAYLNLNGAIGWPVTQADIDSGASTAAEPSSYQGPVKAIKFTTTQANSTVKMWWKGNGTETKLKGDDNKTGNRENAIYDEDRNLVVKTEDNTASDGKGKYVSTLKLKNPGTYYLGGVVGGSGSNFFYKVEITEPQPVENTLDISAQVKAGNIEIKEYALADLKTTELGQPLLPIVSDYFTVFGHPTTTKVKTDDSGAVEFPDGYIGEAYLNLNGAIGWPVTQADIDSGASTATEPSSYQGPVKAIMFTTTSPNAQVKMWWKGNGTETKLKGDDNKTGNRENAIYDEDRNLVVKTEDNTASDGKGKYVSTLKLKNPGTYYLGGVVGGSGSNFFYKITVTEGAVSKVNWEGVPTPKILNVELNEENSDKIDVKVNGAVDADTGAEKIFVDMYNEDDEVVTTQTIMASGDQTVTFAPDKSGKYYFVARAGRPSDLDDEGNPVYAEKVSEKTEVINFIHSLATPIIMGTANDGNGGVSVSWGPVAEADKYIAVVSGYNGTAVETKKTRTTLSTKDLEIGKEYTVAVTAYRGEGKDAIDVSATGTAKFKVTAEAETDWQFSYFGTSTGANRNGHVGSLKDGDAVRVWAVNGGGKIVPNSMDGISYYYVPVPTNVNFKISAKAHVNQWAYNNGQEGFGVMAADRVGTPGTTDYWNNNFMAVVTKSDYYWDGKGYTSDITTGKRNMYLGVSSLARYGITEKNLDVFEKNPGLATQKYFTQNQTALEHTYASFGGGTYNLVKNYTSVATDFKLDPKEVFPTSDPVKTYLVKDDQKQETEQYPYPDNKLRSGTDNSAKAKALMQDEFTLTVEKNNTGYFVSYTYPNGTVETKKYNMLLSKDYTGDENDATSLDWAADALAQIDADYIYAGFFTARNADVTFHDIEYTLIDPTKDKKREDPELTYFDNNSKFVYSSDKVYSNTSDYVLQYLPTWNGKLVVTNGSGLVLKSCDVKEDEYVEIPVVLSFGKNTFKAVMTPDENSHYKYDEEHPANIYNVLKSYAPVTSTLTVNYRGYGEEGTYLYVSPDGTSAGRGTVAEPLDIYTAVKYVKPGQTILVAGGEYKLSKGIRVERGTDGTKDKMIKMIADPESDERPVFNFMDSSNGFVIGGNYWYIKGLEICHTYDQTKGIQLAGSNCILEDLDTHHNGNNGIDLSRLYGSDLNDWWPSNNLVLNCTSYENADAGYEDADGFTCKLTTGKGNVFDGCLSYNNADDGWDLYSKSETGEIGQVIIKNSVCYRNGYIHRNGAILDHGNGNGFKMGGEALFGGHTVINCFSFLNKAKGIDSNSCPDIKAYNCVSFDNESYNVAMYTNNGKATNYDARNLISFRKNITKITNSNKQVEDARDQVYVDKGLGDFFEGAEDMKKEAVINPSVFLWNVKSAVYINAKAPEKVADNKSTNSNGVEFKEEYFKSLDFDPEKDTIGRNEDGTIDMGDMLQLTDEAYEKLGIEGKIAINGTLPSGIRTAKGGYDENGLSWLPTEETGEARKNTVIDPASLVESSRARDMADNDADKAETKAYQDVENMPISNDPVVVVGSVKDQYYTGQPLKPELLVYDGYNPSKESTRSVQLILNKDYTAVYQNNIKAGTANVLVRGIGNYDGKYVKADGSDITFKILPISLDSEFTMRRKNAVTGKFENVSVIDVDDAISEPATGKVMKPVPVVMFDNGKGLKKLAAGNGKDFTVTYYAGKVDASNAAKATPIDSMTEAGTYTIAIAGTYALDGGVNAGGNFTGVRYITYDLYDPANRIDIKTATFPKMDVQILDTSKKGNRPFDLTYAEDAEDGSYKKGEQIYKITVGEEVLKNGVDYQVTYKKNRKHGSATAVITGIGKYAGKVTKTFKIGPGKIVGTGTAPTITVNTDELDVLLKKSEGGVEYTGSPISFNSKIVVYYTGVQNDKSTKPVRLVLGRDFKVEYRNHKFAGTAKAIVKGINAYKGAFAYEYKINPIPDATAAIKDGRLEISLDTEKDADGINFREYSRDGGKVDVTVRLNGNILKAGKDYKLLFMNPTVISKAGEAKSQVKVTFGGKTIVGGSDWLPYAVRTATLDEQTVMFTAEDIIYVNDRTKLNTRTLMYEYDTQRKLKPGKDYDRNLVYALDTNGNGKYDEGVDQTIDSLVAPDETKGGYDLFVVVKGNGVTYAGTTYTTIHVGTVNMKNASTFKFLGKDGKTFDTWTGLETGVELTAEDLKDKITYNGETLVYGKDFEIAEEPDIANPGYIRKAYKNNTKVGIATVTLRGLGKYAGTRVVQYQVSKKQVAKVEPTAE